ncbi:MAG TPA: hypothetical protein VFH74_08935 [Gaiellales bacterium]|nr:hypothetical protein [Gaiellales bacterium]
MTSAAVKLYTVVVAVLCAAAVAWTINQSSAASAWRTEAQSWQTAARRTVAQERAITQRYRHLARQYNQLVVRTRRSQRTLIARMQTAQAAVVPSSGPSAAVPAAAQVAVSTPAPAPSAPTTRTS